MKDTKCADKISLIFNLEFEISKLKVSIPFTELLENEQYRKRISTMIKSSQNGQLNIISQDSLSLDDDAPKFVFCPHVTSANDDVTPFYVSLNVHDLILHNSMLDSEASHNLMAKSVMDQLGLQIIGPYKDLFSFDSRKLKFLWLIKDLVVIIAQIPTKSVLMDIVVAYIPARFGMFLSRSWAERLGAMPLYHCSTK